MTAIFTDFYFDRLLDEINLIVKYGSLNASIIEKDFSLINIDSEYSDINLTIAPDISYYIDLKQLDTFTSLPEQNAKLEENTLNADKKELVTFGIIGKGPGDAKIKIDAIKGSIKIRTKLKQVQPVVRKSVF